VSQDKIIDGDKPKNNCGMNEEKRILLHFVTKYLTKWGQNVVVSGAGVLFGSYDPKR